MSIELANIADAGEIYRFQKIAFNHMVEQYGYQDVKEHIPPVTQNFFDFSEKFDNFTYLKYIVDNQIVGSVRGRKSGDTCIITRLIVHPRHGING